MGSAFLLFYPNLLGNAIGAALLGINSAHPSYFEVRGVIIVL